MRIVLILFIFLALGGLAFAAGQCSSNTWSPSTTYGPVYSNLSSAMKTSYHEFKWNTSQFNSFKSLSANYQYEIRRSKNKWNFFNGTTPWDAVYLTNLPNTSAQFSEETHGSQPFNCCDEEMQLNASSSNLKANFVYYVKGYFNRFVPYETMTSTIESEYCVGAYDLCLVPPLFDWCEMKKTTLTS